MVFYVRLAKVFIVIKRCQKNISILEEDKRDDGMEGNKESKGRVPSQVCPNKCCFDRWPLKN